MVPELDTDGSEQISTESYETTGTDFDAIDGGLEATTTDNQVADPSDFSDIPEEYRPIVESKLKNLESGYTKKYQTLAEERRALESERQALQEQASRYSTTTQPNEANPFAEVDWEYESDATKALYSAFGQMVNYLQQADGKLANVDSFVTEQTRAKEMAELHTKYGDFDDGEFASELSKNPGIPAKFVAAAYFENNVKDQAAQSTYQNIQTKRQANPVTASSAKTVPTVDKSKFGIMDAFRLPNKE